MAYRNKVYLSIICFIVITFMLLISCNKIKERTDVVTVQDMLGDSITIPKNPKKVACISRTTYDLLVAFGLGDRIDGAYKNIYDNPWIDIINTNAHNEYRYEYEENYETFLKNSYIDTERSFAKFKIGD